MNTRDLKSLGVPTGPAMRAAKIAAARAASSGRKKPEIRAELERVVAAPADFLNDRIYGQLAALLAEHAAGGADAPLRDDLTYAVWGDDIDPAAHEQMRNACRLPVTVAAALMPDAHVGYGLPIGGVLATEGAVIPYAVGVDIACRVKVTVFDLPPEQLAADEHRFKSILERETLFGVGKGWRDRLPQHAVMDEDWSVTPLTRRLKDLAWRQLGTSGSGNHFVEFGEIEFGANALGVPPGAYVAVVSHSGSRGAGAQVCSHYSKVARDLHRNLPKELTHLAWLPLDGVGAEYWAAMELMGKYAHANHDVIHRKISKALGAPVVYQIENHHNFAWKERHAGREVIVHRKGATPAGRDVLGYIPGSMIDPGYLVVGRGDPRSLDSASHGAGRRMSRTKARQSTRWSHVQAVLREHGVQLLSAGLDESPHAYKPIDEVMRAQAELVAPIAKFKPRIVKMAPDGERPED
ncbi:MAG: RtcB family protein [Planctomycetota bacterium]|nr:MAG: RtcB family protein [Planctomycetota bacterium]